MSALWLNWLGCVLVWQVRVDIHVLDNDGSVADCCSIAAITALLHFRLI